jgi:cardiolipin synthase
MEAQYESDLGNATEIVLKLPKSRRKPNLGEEPPESKAGEAAADAEPPPPKPANESPASARKGPPYPRARGGSSGRAAAGAMRIANSVGAAIANRRVLGRSESSLLMIAGVALVACAIVGVLWPQLVAWPLAAIACWIGLTLIWSGWSDREQ